MFGYIKSLFGGNDETSGIDALKELLEERERTLNLHAEYQEPTADLNGEPTAVFPYVVYQDDTVYRVGVREFPIPDGGVEEGTPLAEFLGEASIDALDEVEGSTAEAILEESGEISVGVPN